MECDLEKNKQNCPCTYNCDKRGKCCECIQYHRSRNEVPACLFPADIEKTYDRSRQAFIRAYSD